MGEKEMWCTDIDDRVTEDDFCSKAIKGAPKIAAKKAEIYLGGDAAKHGWTRFAGW